MRDLAGKAAGPDDRLYVHFSCHGLSATGLLGGDAVLPADFKTAVPTLSLQIQGLLDYLKTGRFRLQFFFIDACRNVPFAGRFYAGPFPVSPEVTEMKPDVQQFVFAATSRGLRSNEDRTRPRRGDAAGDGSGARRTEPLAREFRPSSFRTSLRDGRGQRAMMRARRRIPESTAKGRTKRRLRGAAGQ